jgi:hypothetical protein
MRWWFSTPVGDEHIHSALLWNFYWVTKKLFEMYKSIYYIRNERESYVIVNLNNNFVINEESEVCALRYSVYTHNLHTFNPQKKITSENWGV